MAQKFKILFLCCALVLSAVNLYKAYTQAIVQLSDRSTIPLHSLGFQFMGLENVFKDVRRVSYYTDKDLTDRLALAQYEQAQYMLAPTVLEINQPGHHWAIFDFTDPQKALAAIKFLGFIPLKINHGIILAFNPGGS